MANHVGIFAYPGKRGSAQVGLSLVLIQTAISLHAQTWTSNCAPTTLHESVTVLAAARNIYGRMTLPP
jgi:hypothetical protein